MKYTNISKGNLNLEQGVCKPNDSAELTTMEAKFLLAQGRVAPYVAPKKKAKAKKNG